MRSSHSVPFAYPCLADPHDRYTTPRLAVERKPCGATFSSMKMDGAP